MKRCGLCGVPVETTALYPLCMKCKARVTVKESKMDEVLRYYDGE